MAEADPIAIRIRGLKTQFGRQVIHDDLDLDVRQGEVQVVIEIPDNTPIRSDAIARLEYQGITGVAFIQIDPGTESASTLEAKPGQRRPEIRSEQSALQQVFESAPEILKGLEELVDQATKVLSDKHVEQISSALSNINAFSGALAASSEDVAVLLTEGAATMEQIRRVAVDAERLVNSFADRSESIAAATDATVSEALALVQDVRDLTEQLDAVAQSVQPILSGAEATVQTYNQLGEDLRLQVDTLSQRVTDTLTQIDGTVGRADERLETVLAEVRFSLDGVNVMTDVAVERIDSVADTTEATLGKFGALADEARLLIAENRGSVTAFSNSGLYEFTQLLSEMRTLVGSLTRVTTQIERDPAQFFFGDSQRGFEVQ